MAKEELSINELEKLSYYDLFAHLNVPFFNIGGRASIDELAEMCHIGKHSRVLEVGCGTGGNACYLAKKYGCTIVGIDVAEHMVQQARERAIAEGLTDKASFEAGDAHHLKFPDGCFDAVITVFVSQFFEIQKIFKEFTRVLKQGGFLGVNEMYKMADIPEGLAQKISKGESALVEITQLPFKLYTPGDWKGALDLNELKNGRIEPKKILPEKGAYKRIIKDLGGWKLFFKLLGKVIKLAWKSKIIRHKFGTLAKAKKILVRQKSTKKYVGYILVSGQKI